MKIALRRVSKFDDENLRYLNEFIVNVVAALGAIEFGTETTGENIYCDILTVPFTAASVELTAAHGLGRVPIGAWPIKKDRIGDFYFSTAPTSANLFLTTNTASLSAVLIII